MARFLMLLSPGEVYTMAKLIELLHTNGIETSTRKKDGLINRAEAEGCLKKVELSKEEQAALGIAAYAKNLYRLAGD